MSRKDRIFADSVNSTSNNSPALSTVTSKDESIHDDSSSSKQPVINEREKKKQAFITRTIWTLIMVIGLFIVLASGHLALICLVLLFQILTFREIISLTSEPARDKKIPYNKSLNWYFLLCSLYYLDSPNLFSYFQDSIYTYKLLTFFIVNHKFISYSLFVAGFIFFVWTLKKGYYKFQFAQLCITHMTLILVVFQSHFIIDNILNGIIWFFLPSSLVIVNDVFAYLVGITIGKTQLIEISPKKTVEGFVGAWICTAFAAVFFSSILSQSDYLICPAVNLSTHLYNFPHCEPNPIFIPQIYQIPQNLIENFNSIYSFFVSSTPDISSSAANNFFIDSQFEIISIKPIYFHSAILATFASLIAPFGGFFASGLKRAFGIKDFGDTIPGHGGITDRLDCQFLMGSFSYLYYQTFISNHNVSIGKILQLAIINLSIPQLIQLIKSLLRYLNNLDVIDDDKLRIIFDLLDN